MHSRHPVECSRYWMYTLWCTIALCWCPLGRSLECLSSPALLPLSLSLFAPVRTSEQVACHWWHQWGLLSLHWGFELVGTIGRRRKGAGGGRNVCLWAAFRHHRFGHRSDRAENPNRCNNLHPHHLSVHLTASSASWRCTCEHSGWLCERRPLLSFTFRYYYST